MGLFKRTKVNDKTQLPVWFMRQAGRYHAHYQNIKKNSNFLEMCKNPDLATKVTMGPIDEFDFDAAILFSDLLFPLDHLGMNIQYNPGPKTDFLVKDLSDLNKFNIKETPETYYQFQKDACKKIRGQLASHKDLLGFVGAPFTLYAYATEGTHSNNLVDAKLGLFNGLYEKMLEQLLPSLWAEMDQQAEGMIDAICLFDTAAGELEFNDFKKFILPSLRQTTAQFKKKYPNIKIIYYTKHTHLNYLHAIEDENIDVLGIDWRVDLKSCLTELGEDYIIQGNIDPTKLCLPWDDLQTALEKKWQEALSSNISLDRYIFGLGHGVIPQVPQENVLKSVQYIHDNFKY